MDALPLFLIFKRLICLLFIAQLTLEKPFSHPTLEEGLRTALKHARRQLK